MRPWKKLKTIKQKLRRLKHLRQVFWYRTVVSPLSNSFYWLRTHTINRYHLIDVRDKRNGYAWGWIDRDRLVLHACFVILANFIEKEDPQCGLRELPDNWSRQDWDQWDRPDKELRALYNWWTKERPEKLAQQAKKYTYESDQRLFEEEDTMLLRLMKVRSYMWT